MQAMIWIGAALTLVGLGGIVWSLVLVARARRAGGDDAALRARLARAVPVNLAAFLVSLLGLLCVVTGVALG